MTNDLERVTRMAKGCLGIQTGLYMFTPEELLAFEQAVLAKRDEQYWDAESAAKEMDNLQAKLSMQAEALNLMLTQFTKTPSTLRDTQARGNAHAALNATQADVDNWMAKKKAEWEKGVLEECMKRLHNCYGVADGDLKDSVIEAMIKERGGVR